MTSSWIARGCAALGLVLAVAGAAGAQIPRMDPKTNPMPFDGARMIYGGFANVVDLRKD